MCEGRGCDGVNARVSGIAVRYFAIIDGSYGLESEV